jgi:hypothetical protein
VAREVNQLLGRIFAQRRKDGRTDLEAVESALRTALHQAGAAAFLSELLQFEIPEADQRQLPCPSGHHSQYHERRSRPQCGPRNGTTSLPPRLPTRVQASFEERKRIYFSQMSQFQGAFRLSQ